MRKTLAGLAGVAILCLSLSARADYVGDYAVGTDNICAIANFYQPSTGASFALASAAVDVYKDDSDTQDNDSGLTISAFDSLTGAYMVCVDTSSDGTFYSAGSIFHVLVSVGTVDSVSVVGSELMTFSLAKGPLAAGAITATVIATDAIGAAEVAAGAIAADAFASGAIDATAIAADAIGSSELAANSITSSEVADDSIDAGAIAASAITNSELASDGSEFTSVGVASISGDTAAADNLEAVLDLIVNTGNGAFPPFGISASGTAQSYTAGTPDFVLASATAAANDDFNGQTLTAWGDEGELQSACIEDYVGATDTATLVDAFNTNITGTIRYVIYPTLTCQAAAGSGATAQEVWEYADRQLTALDEDATTLDLNATAVVTGSITDGAIAAADFAAGAIDASAIATDAIGAAEIATDAIGAAEIAASAITNSELASDGSEFTAIDLPNQTMDITGTLSTVTTATNVTTVNGFANDALVAADINADVGTEFARAILDTAVDGALDVEEMLCYLTAVIVNQMDYNGTDEAVFDNAAGDTPKVTITYANGDRTAITLAACGN